MVYVSGVITLIFIKEIIEFENKNYVFLILYYAHYTYMIFKKRGENI